MASLVSIQRYLFRFGGPILISIGTVNCLLNLIVFTQKTLRKNPCSIYFIAYNCANFMYIYCALLFLTVSFGYDIDPSIYNLPFCRSRLYTALLFHSLSQFCLILASIDRILITSRNALTRHRSTCRFACICLVAGTIFWVVFHSHVLIFSSITQIGPNSFLCSFQKGIEANFVNYYTIFKETLLLLLMIICGWRSINNIRNIHRVRIVPNESVRRIDVESSVQLTSSKDRQFILMLIFDITMYALFSFCNCNISHISTNHTKLYEKFRSNTT